MRSLFHTRNAPQCTRFGSLYSAKLKWKFALSQPWLDLPNFSKGLSSIMGLPLDRQNGALAAGIKFPIGNGRGSANRPVERNGCSPPSLPKGACEGRCNNQLP